MALSRLDNLYRQVILDHSAHPHHRGQLEQADAEIEMNNPTCGDVIQLQLRIEADKIADIRFAGDGCTISMASASMMTDAVMGKTVEEAMMLIDSFSELVQGKEPDKQADLGEAALLSGVAKFPARIKCATLAWKALGQGLIEQKSTIKAAQLHTEDKPTKQTEEGNEHE